MFFHILEITFCLTECDRVSLLQLQTKAFQNYANGKMPQSNNTSCAGTRKIILVTASKPCTFVLIRCRFILEYSVDA